MKQILCFGDSNTWGLIPGMQDRYAWGERWTSLLQEALIGRAHVVEEGLCGRTTIFEDGYRANRRGIDCLPLVLESQGPLDLIVFMLGTNDCKRAYGASPAQITEGVAACLDQIEAYAPESQILLLSPIHLGERVYEENFDPEFAEESVALSKELPLYYEKLAQDRGSSFLAASDYAKASCIDQEHLDLEGHKRLARVILSRIEDMLWKEKRDFD